MMKFSVKQVFMIFAVFIAVFAVLRGVQWIYLRSAIRSPLMQSISRINGVRQVQVSPQGTVTVSLSKDANLMTTYEAIDNTSTQITGHNPRQIIIRDHASPTMNAMVNTLRLIIAQGEATGQYVAMNKSIQTLAKDHHMTATVELGNHHIFVSLQSQNHWLDQVMPLRLGGGGA
ncbi:hypothetical protein SAMN00768000_3222 [Sulfobacillus thermosulfidooxidans DSM 9293]|uniref:Uncharacterized protein n=2 Tax=Sulfobacillus thermosulfidooxidans TaxID=28034 RepID=A0A1W1WN20_SULTA|nr:hypothetical protein [Sulfobacillus thermosulfidooxidans]PSR29762.1 MAG: hypothetical protein C7B47_00160 [Sulfobacillus thermosulfidooxidans]SMC07133.1 hypothetical protein SAMN00768000_3222 [Sulfobacillus thermosulfidooxidans DSM 9293]